MQIKTFVIEDEPIVFVVDGTRGIVINPMEEQVEIDTQIPDRIENPFDYLFRKRGWKFFNFFVD